MVPSKGEVVPTMADEGSQTTNRYSFASIRKDPLDLRDLMYEGSLTALPREIDNRDKVPKVLDQLEEGACTGFGLAAVVNYLIANDSEAAEWHRIDDVAAEGAAPAGDGDGPPWLASPRMLYEMARRYDEWPGESYEGSSIRGAMKGWHRHGVCRNALWRYTPGQPGRPDQRILRDARRRPLGNYFRVRHLHLSHMHAALREVGIVYASARVHSGWERVRRDGRIPFEYDEIGGHAFAIVGYDARGFWIQNSWGDDWGRKGFGLITYDDWLENAWDCWVARLGVPVEVADGPTGVFGGRASTFGQVTDEPTLHAHIKPHFVNLGNDGGLSNTGRCATTPDDVRRIFDDHLPTITAGWTRPRVLLYAHGGLNSEGASARRIAQFLPHFLANEIYPLHFMWETGVLETIRNIVQDAFRAPRFTGWAEGLRDRFRDLLDEAIELAARPLGRPLWREMQENAERASGTEGGAAMVALGLAAYLKNVLADRRPEIHLVGHSAGSILLAHLVPVMASLRVPVKRLTLFAPACTITLFRDVVLPRVGGGGPIDSVALFNLSDRTERGDSVGPYGKSLLYLVSHAFEGRRGTPLLGLEHCIEGDDSVREALGKGHASDTTVVYAGDVPAGVRPVSASKTHGGFDDDAHTLNTVLRLVTGRKKLRHPFPDEVSSYVFGPDPLAR